MIKSVSDKKIAQNTMISIGAQAVSLIISLLVNLIVPKFIDEYQYAYWQSYLLYVSYVGLLHFGILDGIALRFSQYDYNELDKDKMSYFFYVLLSLLSCFVIVGFIFGLSKQDTLSRTIICFVSVSIITRNIMSFASYSFQITNRIRYYANTVILQRIFYGSTSLLMLVIGVKYFYFFCVIDLLTDLIGFLYSIRYNKQIYSIRQIKTGNYKDELCITMSAGVMLLIANFSGNFIIGSSKIFIQNLWEPIVFGHVSFGFSITNIFLNFVMAISVVLFPSLKRIEPERLPVVYKSIRSAMIPIFLIAMLLYFPICVVLGMWLPLYENSLIYTGVLLPIIIYSTRVSLLTNNYLKAYRREKQMLILNLSCIFVEFAGLVIVGYSMRNLEFVLIWTVIIIVIRAILAEMLVSHIIRMTFVMQNVFEILIATIFVFCTMRLERIEGFCVYGISVLLYLVCYGKDVRYFMDILKRR